MSPQNDQKNIPIPRPLQPREVLENKRSTGDLLPNERNWLNLSGALKTLTTIPTAAPKSMADSVVIYMDDVSAPATKRLYVYSREAGIWNYVTLT